MLGNALSGLAVLQEGVSRSISAENPQGEKGKGGMATGKLGPSRKGSPCIRLVAGETRVLAQIDGAGTIAHIWCTVFDKTTDADCFVLRDLVLRIYWDDSPHPAVETPLGDFFCCGFGVDCSINSLPIVVCPKRGMNCYFPMPFRHKAVITIENQHPNDIDYFFYQIDYRLVDTLPERSAFFHAQWRRERLTKNCEDYTVLDGVSGRGQYVGTYLALTTLERYWWGEGEFKFYLDGDEKYPTICGTGTEDYFGGAWSFAEQEEGRTVERTYSTPFLGYPYYSTRDRSVHNPFHNDDCPPMRGLYRFHILDPILFDKNIRITLQQIGTCHRGLFERQDDVATVAYWYQDFPDGTGQRLPCREARWPR